MKRAASAFSCLRKKGSLPLVRLQHLDEVGGRDIAQEMQWFLLYRWVMLLLQHFFATGIMAMRWPFGFTIHGEVFEVVPGTGWDTSGGCRAHRWGSGCWAKGCPRQGMGEEPSRGNLRDQIGFTGAVWAAKWGRMGSLRQLPQEHRLLHGESFSLVFLPTHTAMMSGANPSPFLVQLVPAQTGRAAFLAQKVFWTFSTYSLLLEGVVAVGLQFHPCSGQEIVFTSGLPAMLARVSIYQYNYYCCEKRWISPKRAVDSVQTSTASRRAQSWRTWWRVLQDGLAGAQVQPCINSPPFASVASPEPKLLLL